MPKLRTETFNSRGSQAWRATEHGLFNARTATLDAEAFAAVQTANGKIPAGYPVVETAGKAAPWTSGSADPFIGHVLFDQTVEHGDVAAPIYYQGAVNTARVPAEGFTAPATQTKTSIAYL